MANRTLLTIILVCAFVGLPVVLLVGPAAAQWVAAPPTGRTFSIPSESMEPTLMVGDRIMPHIVTAAQLRRGMVIVFALGAEWRVARIAGLPGDTVQMREGHLVLNGKPVAQRADGDGPPGPDGRLTTRYVEQMPGEQGSHRVLDSGVRPQDETDAVTVPAGTVFLLGDNRDDASDSRFQRATEATGAFGATGAGFVPFGDIHGRVDFIAWSVGRWRIGRAIEDTGPDRIFTWL
jgi:signal peptidase I